MAQTAIVIIVAILVIILIIILTIVLIKNANNTISTNNTGTTALPLLSQPCLFKAGTTPNSLGSLGICGTGLICTVNNTCVLDLGTPCGNLTQCTPSANVCSGKCANGPSGGLNQFCPCNEGLTCVVQSDGFNVCKGSNGSPCVTNNDCLNMCINNVCTGGLSAGSQCLGSQCAPGLYCDPTNHCQPTGIISGQQNAFCFPTTAPTCNNPLVCMDNICQSTFSTLGSNCTNQLCNIPLECDAIPPVPPGNTGVNACVFSNDNTCVNNCVPGFTCTGSKCLAQNFQFCVADSNCVTGNCEGNNSLFYWTGSHWNNLATAPTDTYLRINVLYRNGPNDNVVADLYMLGIGGLRFYDFTANIWTITVQNPAPMGNIIDTAIDHNNNPFLMIDTKGTDGVVITDINFNPISNFGTAAGNLIIGGNPVPLNSFDIDVNGNVISTDTNGKLYVNTVMKVNSGASKARAFGNDTTVQNYAYISNSGVKTVGQLNNNTFPLFPVKGVSYNKIADYSIHVENSISVPTSVNAAASKFYAIASPDGINYQLILDSAAFQTVIPGYVGAADIVGNNGPDLYLYSARICMN
jgi:hypothetical protein